MNKNKTLSRIIEIWAYTNDVNVLDKYFTTTHYETSINDILKNNKDIETYSMYKLTKKGKLKLIYLKEDTQWNT